MPELRYNIVTADWVVVAPERSHIAHARGAEAAPSVAPFVAGCPFCPGNEHDTETETARYSENGAWALRAVLNRFPALSPSGPPERLGSGYTRSLTGVGQHEVVIEARAHDARLGDLPECHLTALLRLYRERMAAFYTDPHIEHVIVFKNHGATAGSSLDHPHSQIVGTPVMPGQVRHRLEVALRRYSDYGECMFCYVLRQELEARLRIVEENESFVAFVPYAALSPYHLWIFPKRHRAYFGVIDDADTAALARLLKRTLARLSGALGAPHYNFVIRSLSPPEAEVKYFHWYMSLIVRGARLAGFELGTGMFINTALPEESARVLRAIELGDP